MSRQGLVLLVLLLLSAAFAWQAYRGEAPEEYGEPATRADHPVRYYLLMGMQLLALLAGWGLLPFGGW